MTQTDAKLKVGDQVLSLSTEVATFGRESDNTIVVNDASISGHHAELFTQDDVHYVRDLGSTNGTRLNGQPVTVAELETGDVITFGAVDATFIATTSFSEPPDSPVIPTPIEESLAPTGSNSEKIQRRLNVLKPFGVAIYGIIALSLVTAVYLVWASIKNNTAQDHTESAQKKPELSFTENTNIQFTDDSGNVFRINIHRVLMGDALLKNNVCYPHEPVNERARNKELIYFEVSATNLSTLSQHIFGKNFTLEDVSGFTYPNTDPLDGFNVELLPTKSARGGVMFTIPRGGIPKTLIFKTGYERVRTGETIYCLGDLSSIALRVKAGGGNADAQFNLGSMYAQGRGVPKDEVEAVKWLRKAAEQGLVDAQHILGLIYAKGRGVPKDDVEAVKWLRKAADQGEAEAQFNLGLMYAQGRGVSKNEVEALKWCRKAAEQGLVDAQFNLGVSYSNGEGVPKDDVEAAKWLRKAADQGEAEAQFLLGSMYAQGRGVPKDDVEASRWFRKAADLGYAEAQGSLGVRYKRGDGVSKNLVEAAMWVRKAADQGNAKAQFSLGVLYENGEGVPKDDVEAYQWFLLASVQGITLAMESLVPLEKTLTPEQRAEGQRLAREFKPRKQFAEQTQPSLAEIPRTEPSPLAEMRAKAEGGEAVAQYNFGAKYVTGEGVPKDVVEAAKWIRKAADQGYAVAQYFLGFLYANGLGVSKDEVEAAKWYRQAADQRHAAAQYSLGVSYANGEGVPKDAARAYQWLLLAVTHGNTFAKEHIDRLEKILTSEQRAEGQRLAREFKPKIAGAK